MNSIAPVWDGNETWLVMGGGGLMAAFPLAYAVILPALYPPIIAMLLGLVFRGVAFEFRLARRAASRILGPRLRRRLAGRRAVAGHGRSARSCRASRSKDAPMPAAGGIG